MTYAELYSALENLFPTSLRASFDNDGDMLVTDSNRDVSKALISLDADMGAINYAAENGFDLIITHHPLIFSPCKRIDFRDPVGARIIKSIEYGIQVMSFHTRLDCIAVNACLSHSLSLNDVRIFNVDGLPMGRIGTLPRPMSCIELACYIKDKLACESVAHPLIDKQISSLALIGGSGCSEASAARSAGADALLTGDYSYHALLDNGEIGFPIFAAGHFFTENAVCTYLKNTLNLLCCSIYTEIYNSNTLTLQ